MGQRRAKCGDCGCLEGEFHELGCDMEPCPFCGGQLISCDCMYRELGLLDRSKYKIDTAYLPPEIYADGVGDKESAQWETILEKQGRIPFIEYPILCARCGKLWPDFFMVPNDEWKRYIQPDMRDEVLCLKCYEFIKATIDRARR